MAEQQRKSKQSPAPRSDESPADAPSTGTDSRRLKDELDELLDEIDEVLESNAEDFVKSYVQKGGQ
jgi:ubiquitin-like protein Pup